ncbi:hypothetical protein FA13DRAFT_1774140 [Coprinellus micaceus]|uniref:Uncharacterized protein n=1 Tax=Coprinellus micaceus TaxID=71717 RepID=A0A4Y7TBX8_COPMI|nr:hypothetical protein FA13DRAFT_1774140 [Coprinellus micaceus]
MEPCRIAVKGHRRLHRPFAVVPFLFYYETNELSQFMRTHLDPPFNERFSKFIQVVQMKGADYVRLSTKDLGRLCDGEGDHLSDLQIFQNALYKPRRRPKSPHVCDIFSLPALHLASAPQGADPFGHYTAELTFDYPDDDEAEPVFECIIPLPSTPSPLASIELPLAEEASEGESDPAFPSSTPPYEHDDEESLIDMFSPVSPSMGPFSEWSKGVPDVFDEEHLDSLCTSPTSPAPEDLQVVDILGLLPQGPGSPKEEELEETPSALAETEMESGSDLCGSEEAEFGGDDVESSAAGEPSLLEDIPSSLLSTPRALVDKGDILELSTRPSPSSDGGSLLILDGEVNEQSTIITDSPSTLVRDVHVHPTEHTAGSPHSTLSTQTPLPGPDAVSSELSTYGDDHEVDIDDLRTLGDGFGLSSFFPDLRSLDFSLPPSPHLDAPSGCDSLSLDFSVSPDPTSIHTPSTSVLGDDHLIISSPSASYRGPHEGLLDFFFNPERIMAKRLDLALGLEPISESTRSVEADGTAVRRPHLGLTIPTFPSLLEDEELTSWMSSIELTRAKSQRWISLPPSSSMVSLSRSSSTGSDRSIWPVRSDVVGRHLPSPHMKESPKSPGVPEREDDVEEEHPQENFESKTDIEHGEGVSDDPPRSDSEDSSPSPPSKPLVTPATPYHQPPTEAHSVLGRVGGFFWTILTPVEVGEDVGGQQSLPGGLS